MVYADAHGGSLAEATSAGRAGRGLDSTDLPATPAAASELAATTYLLPSAIPATPGDFPGQPGSTTSSTIAAPLGTEAFYLTSAGSPAVVYNDGTGWRTGDAAGHGDRHRRRHRRPGGRGALEPVPVRSGRADRGDHRRAQR